MCEFCKCVLNHTFCFSFCFRLFLRGGLGMGKEFNCKRNQFFGKEKATSIGERKRPNITIRLLTWRKKWKDNIPYFKR